MMSPRRRMLAGLAALPLLARGARAGPFVLRVGDQKGGTQSVMKAAGMNGAGALDGLPYPLEWSQFSAAAPLLEALNAGAVDLAFAGDAPTTFAMAAGLRARIISPIRTTGAGTAIMVPQASPIHAAADLRGRSIATNRGSIGHSLVLALAEAQGWKGSDVKLVNLMPAEARSALSAGAVDAWCSWGVYVAQARLVDAARVVVDGSGGLLPGVSYLVASDEAIRGHHAALADFCRRLVAARRWAAAHADAYAAVLAAEIGVAPSIARLVFATDQPRPVAIDGSVIRDQQNTADRYFAAGVTRTRLDAAGAFDDSFNLALVE